MNAEIDLQISELVNMEATLQLEIEEILKKKEHIYNTKDLWEPKWGDLWDRLEEKECALSGKKSTIQEVIATLKKVKPLIHEQQQEMKST